MQHRHAPDRAATPPTNRAEEANDQVARRVLSRLFQSGQVALDDPDPVNDVRSFPDPDQLRRLLALADAPVALRRSWQQLAAGLERYLQRRARLGDDGIDGFVPFPEVSPRDLDALQDALVELDLGCDALSHLVRTAAGASSDLALSGLSIALGDVSRSIDEERIRIRVARIILRDA